jgi:hypothetical protein
VISTSLASWQFFPLPEMTRTGESGNTAFTSFTLGIIKPINKYHINAQIASPLCAWKLACFSLVFPKKG